MMKRPEKKKKRRSLDKFSEIEEDNKDEQGQTEKAVTPEVTAEMPNEEVAEKTREEPAVEAKGEATTVETESESESKSKSRTGKAKCPEFWTQNSAAVYGGVREVLSDIIFKEKESLAKKGIKPKYKPIITHALFTWVKQEYPEIYNEKLAPHEIEEIGKIS